MAYDIYRKYVNPDCTGKQLLKASRIAGIVLYAYGDECSVEMVLYRGCVGSMMKKQ